MTASTTSAQAAIKAAMSVARDVAEGRLDPDALDAAAAAECRALFGRVEGPGDPLWSLHVDVFRQVLAIGGGCGADEMAEWAAVYRHAEGTPVDADAGEWTAEACDEVLAWPDEPVAKLGESDGQSSGAVTGVELG